MTTVGSVTLLPDGKPQFNPFTCSGTLCGPTSFWLLIISSSHLTYLSNQDMDDTTF